MKLGIQKLMNLRACIQILVRLRGVWKKSKLRAITSPIDPECLNSVEIDEANSKIQHVQKSAFVLDEEVVRQAKPDFIISQNTCEVCAAHTTHVGNAVRILSEKPKLYEMNPHTIKDILDGIEDLANKVGLGRRGTSLVESLRARISNVSKKCAVDAATCNGLMSWA